MGIFKKKTPAPKNDKDNPDYGTMQLLATHEGDEEQEEHYDNDDEAVNAEQKFQTELEMV